MCSVGRFSYELSKFLEEVPYSTAHAYIVPLSLFLVREAPKLNKAIWSATVTVWFCKTILAKWLKAIRKWRWVTKARMKMDCTMGKFRTDSGDFLWKFAKGYQCCKSSDRLCPVMWENRLFWFVHVMVRPCSVKRASLFILPLFTFFFRLRNCVTRVFLSDLNEFNASLTLETLLYSPLFNEMCICQVFAIDHSGRLLDAALKLQQGKSLEINCAKDSPFISIPLNEIEANIDRVQFQQVSVSWNRESVRSEICEPTCI